jgi:hypothetical protein
MKYYEVMVEIVLESEDSKGNVKVKRNKEIYLVDAMSVTEAEARVVKLFSGFTQEFQVFGVKSSKIVEVIESEEKKPLVKISSRIKTEKDDAKKEQDAE